jgi:serine/threonine protein kinase
MVVNPDEVQFVLLSYFTRLFATGNVKDATPSTSPFRFVKCYNEVGVCSKAEDVFRAQPTRLFIHGYTIVNGKLALWLFSRRGIRRTPFLQPGELTIERLSAYHNQMTDFQFGFNSLISTDELGQYVLVKGLDKLESCLSDFPRTYKIRLDKDPIIYPQEIVSNRPTCYRATDSHGNEFAVKFSPKQAESRHEAKLLRRVTQRNIWGVAQLIDSRTVHLDTFTSSCVVTSPFARDLEDYDSIEELMKCLRDVIAGHYYLYHDGKILHRDISLGNIMITNNYRDNPRAPCGILIDLDRSLDLETEPKKPYNLQGTKAFMAIDISRPYDDHILHTYRHDLESFFYVFLYLAVCRNKRLPKSSRLTRWMDAKKDWAEVGRMKREDMSDNRNFATIVGEFQPSFKGLGLGHLAYELRTILFFSGNEFFVGTKTEAGDVENLYNEVFGAFASWAKRLDYSNVRW